MNVFMREIPFVEFSLVSAMLGLGGLAILALILLFIVSLFLIQVL